MATTEASLAAAYQEEGPKDKTDSVVAHRLGERAIRVLPTRQKDRPTPVMVHHSATIAEGALFGIEAGPIGRNSEIKDGALIRGSIRSNVTVEERAVVGRLSKIGTWVKDSTVEVGSIIIGAESIVDNNCLIFSPTQGSVTVVGPNVQLGSGVRIGDIPPKNNPGKPSKPISIGARSVLAHNTIVQSGASIGEDVHIHEGYTVGSDVIIPAGLTLPEPDSSLLSEGRRLITNSFIQQFIALEGS